MVELNLVDTPDGRVRLQGRVLHVVTPRGEARLDLDEAAAEALTRAAPGAHAPLEVERKFLVHTAPTDLNHHPSAHLRQGYVVLDAAETLRIREKKGRTKLTLKRGRGLSRQEVEIEIQPNQAARLWPLAGNRVLEKRRYEVPDGDGVLEVDLYEGSLAGLMTAEREFGTEGEAEAWIGPEWVETEVTDDPRFTNAQLAAEGRRP